MNDSSIVSKQMGWAPIVILGAMDLYVGYLALGYPSVSTFFLMLVVFTAGFMLFFWSLTVRVDNNGVTVWLSRGFVRRHFSYTEIASASSGVTLPFNFGIRFNTRGDEWYRVSGGEDLILNLRNGTRFTIGIHNAVSLATAVNGRLAAFQAKA